MKKFKKIVTTVLCSMMVLGTVLTVSAAESACAHTNYVVDSYEYEYDATTGGSHFVYRREERFCMICQEYFTEREYDHIETHTPGADGRCIYCEE